MNVWSNLIRERKVCKEHCFVTSSKALFTKNCGFLYTTSRAFASFTKCLVIIVLQFTRLWEPGNEIRSWFTQGMKRTSMTGWPLCQGLFHEYITMRAPPHQRPSGQHLCVVTFSFARFLYLKVRCSQLNCFGARLVVICRKWKAERRELYGGLALIVCLIATLGGMVEGSLPASRAALLGFISRKIMSGIIFSRTRGGIRWKDTLTGKWHVPRKLARLLNGRKSGSNKFAVLAETVKMSEGEAKNSPVHALSIFSLVPESLERMRNTDWFEVSVAFPFWTVLFFRVLDKKIKAKYFKCCLLFPCYGPSKAYLCQLV